MPTYSYACTDCGDRFDATQAFTDNALTTCRKCAGRLRKIFSSVGVVFKGSGFYRTDSRDSGKSSLSGVGNGQSKSTSAESGSADKPAADKPAAPAKTEKATAAASS